MISDNLQNSLKPMIYDSFGQNRATPWTLRDTRSFAYYRMDYGVVDVGGGKVASWVDSLNNEPRLLSQSVAVNRPTLTSSGVLFNGTSEFLTNSNPFITNSQNGVIVIALMSAPVGTAGGQQLITETNTLATSQRLSLLCKDAQVADRGRITQLLRNDANTTVLTLNANTGIGISFDNTLKLITHKFNKITGICSTAINTIEETTPIPFTFSGTFTLNAFNLGAVFSTTTTVFFNGTIKALAFLDPSITDSDLQKAYGYIAHSFNNASLLPSNHPYKNSPPLK